MPTPLLSIIIPVYNVERYLRECLDSVLAQTFTDFEVLLVNDGSTDRSLEICREYAEKDSRIVLVSQANQGLSGARNTGIDSARGEWLGFVDSDDRIAPHMFQSLLHAAVSSNSDIAICGVSMFNAQGAVYPQPHYKTDCIISSQEASIELLKDYLIQSFAWNKIYKRVLFKHFRFPVGRYFEDTALIYKIVHASRQVSIVADSLYFYRMNPNSICRIPILKTDIKRRFDNFLAFFERYLWVIKHEQYRDIIPACAEKAFIFGSDILYYSYIHRVRIDNACELRSEVLSRLSQVSHAHLPSHLGGRLKLLLAFPTAYIKWLAIKKSVLKVTK